MLHIFTECASAADLYTIGCVIPIMHNLSGNGTNYMKYNAWSEGDFYLDWAGPETTQGLFSGQPAEGTPTIRTTNISGEGYSYLNTYVKLNTVFALNIVRVGLYQPRYTYVHPILNSASKSTSGDIILN